MINRTFSTLTVLTNSIKRKFKEYLPPFFSFQVLGGVPNMGAFCQSSLRLTEWLYDHDIKTKIPPAPQDCCFNHFTAKIMLKNLAHL